MVWSLALYFFSVRIGVRRCYGYRAHDKAPRFSVFLAFLLASGLVLEWSNIPGNPAVTAVVAAFWSFLEIGGMALAVTPYRASWQMFRSLDF